MELVEGINLIKDILSSHFVTDQEKMNCELENPYILLYDGKIIFMNDILTIY